MIARRRRAAAGAGFLAIALLLAAPACGRRDLDTVPKDRDAALTPAQLLEKGQTLMRRGRYYRARSVLEKVLSRPGAEPALIAEANLGIADAYYYDGGVINLAEALSRYTSFLTFYPSHPRADYVQYQLGLCYLKQSLAPDKDQSTTRQALDAFRKVELNYPGSGFSTAAREKADEARERLAESEARIGYYYVRKGAWNGAVDRFRDVLENYPRYRKRDRVYYELGRALVESKKLDEGLLYWQKVVEEFPKSRWAASARDGLERAGEAGGKTAEAGKGKKSSRRGSEPPASASGG